MRRDEEMRLTVKYAFWVTVITIAVLANPSNIPLLFAATYIYGSAYHKLSRTRVLHFLLD
jgi:hypothetical protein